MSLLARYVWILLVPALAHATGVTPDEGCCMDGVDPNRSSTRPLRERLATEPAIVARLDLLPTLSGPELATLAKDLTDRVEGLLGSIHSHEDPRVPTLEALREAMDVVAVRVQKPEFLSQLNGVDFGRIQSSLGFDHNATRVRQRVPSSILDKATRRRFQKDLASALAHHLKDAGIHSQYNLNDLRHPDLPGYSRLVLNLAEEHHREIFPRLSRRKPVDDAVGETLAALYQLDDNPEFWTSGRFTRIAHFTRSLSGEVYQALVDSGKIKVDTSHGKPIETRYGSSGFTYASFARHGLTEGEARSFATRLAVDIDFLGERANKWLAEPASEKSDQELRTTAEHFLDPDLYEAAGIPLVEKEKYYSSRLNLNSRSSIEEQIFYLNRNSFDHGALHLQIYDPDRMTVDGKPLTLEQRRLVWRFNIMAGMEESLHVVQRARNYSGWDDTRVNVSDWARSQPGAAVDDEADVYARFLEVFGPLPPVYLSNYSERLEVPQSLAWTPRPSPGVKKSP